MFFPVGLIAIHDDIRAELAQHAGCGFIGRAVRAIDDDAHAFERHAPWQRGLGLFDITAQCVIDTNSFADVFGGRANVLNLAAGKRGARLRVRFCRQVYSHLAGRI